MNRLLRHIPIPAIFAAAAMLFGLLFIPFMPEGESVIPVLAMLGGWGALLGAWPARS